MKRFVKWIVLLSMLAVPSIARAGCQVTAGAMYPTLTSEVTGSDVDCTSNNGSYYQLRIYAQGNAGGWHSVSTGQSHNIYSPSTGFHGEWSATFPCTLFAQSDTQSRNKSVLENMTTHTKDISYGPPHDLGPACY